MFTQPSVNQITKAYVGQPAPLQAKVDQDKKQHGGIPQDLRQLLALNDITEMREGAGIQQALNAPVNMPTVAQNIQQQAKKALEAKMVQEAQQRMAKEGQMGIPQGVPQPVPQPQGIDTLPANVGESYFHGGVVSFEEGGLTADQILRQQMAINEETKRAEEIARREREVGKQDTTQVDRLMAELEDRKSKLAPPKPGYDAVMEYLSQIAATPRGLSSAEAGSQGAASLKALQLARAEQQNALTEKGIELAQRKADQGYQYKSDQYNVGKTAAADAVKQRFDAAIAVARTDQEIAKLKQEKELELKKIAAMNKPAEGIQVANMLMAADGTLSKEEALKRGYMISKSGELKQEQNETARLKALEDAEKDFLQIHNKDMRKMYATNKKPEYKAQYDAWVEERDAKLKELRARRYPNAESGGLPQALATQATPTATPTAGGYTAMVNGRVFNFPTQAAADAFKQASGAK